MAKWTLLAAVALTSISGDLAALYAARAESLAEFLQKPAAGREELWTLDIEFLQDMVAIFWYLPEKPFSDKLDRFGLEESG